MESKLHFKVRYFYKIKIILQHSIYAFFEQYEKREIEDLLRTWISLFKG